MSGAVPGVPSRGTVVPVLVHGVQVSGVDLVDLAGSMGGTTVVVLHHLPLLTQKKALHPNLKAEVPDSGQVWQQVVWVHTSSTEPPNHANNLNLNRNLNRRLGTGNGPGWRDRLGGLVNPNRNRHLHRGGDRLRRLMIIEEKVPRTWVR